MLEIGLNASILASKGTLNNAIGQKAAALRRAAREIHELKMLLDQITDAELAAKGFGDGTNDTPNEIAYGIRDPLICGEDIYKILNGQTPQQTQPHDYDAQLRYVAGGQG